jgi:hypothetical protein
MIVGALTLFAILPAYEIFISKRGRETYLPLHLFKNIRFQSAAWNTGLAAGVYYGFSIVFPQIVTVIYYGRGEISEYDIGTLAGLAPMSFVFAQMCHGPIVWFTGPKYGMIGGAVIGVACLTACAADIDNRQLTMGLLMGIVESISITTSTFPLRSQEEIGQGGGLSGSTRNFVSAISLAVYTATLNNRLNRTVPARIDAVATGLGLPAGSLAALAAAVRGTASYDAVPGITDAIREAIQEPYRLAFRDAARTVFFVSLAFSGSALILSFFTTENDESTADYVAAGMHGKVQEKGATDEKVVS